MTRFLVTGAGGMLGHDLVAALGGRDLTAATRSELDITDPDAVDAAVAGHDVVVNAAAYTAVDAAETDEDAAYAVNATAVGTLAAASARHGARFVTISTDYVFDGRGTAPYPEDAPLDPLNAYGRTKAAGERAALRSAPGSTYVVRTAWVYGEHGASFPATMLRLAASHETVSVVDDQRGQPTWTRELAERVVALVDAEVPSGVYHATASGSTTWYGLARAVFAEAGLDPDRVIATTSDAFRRPAPRPSYSVLGHDAFSRVGLGPMRGWREALADAFSAGALAA